MSGGHFQYAFRTVENFSEDLDDELDHAGQPNLFGGYFDSFSPEVTSKLREIAKQAYRLSRLMREVEWLYSGDIHEDTFMKRIAEIENAAPNTGGGG